MIETIKEAFAIVKNNFILTSAFIVIFITMQLFSIVVVLRQPNVSLLALVSIIILNLLSLGLFSGWLNIAKKLINNDEKIEFASSFFSGIGEKFFTNLKLGVFYSLLFSFIVFLTFSVITHFYPSLNLSGNDIIQYLKQLETLPQNPELLFQGKNAVILLWVMFFDTAFHIGLYLFSFLLADVYINDETNFLKNLCKVSKFLFKNFGLVILNFLFLGFLYMLVSMFVMLTSPVPLLNFIAFILIGYYASFYIIMVFLLYDKNKEKNNCDNGCDSDRQNEICD